MITKIEQNNIIHVKEAKVKDDGHNFMYKFEKQDESRSMPVSSIISLVTLTKKAKINQKSKQFNTLLQLGLVFKNKQ